MRRAPVDHRLKIEPRWFDRLVEGSKTCEIRRNDRDFQIGDTITVGKCRDDGPYRRCYGACNSPDRLLVLTITHVLPGGQYGIEPGWCVLSLAVNQDA